MFKGIKRKIRETGEKTREFTEVRKSFGKNIWEMFMDFIRKSRNRKLVTQEIPFGEAMTAWGFGQGERAVRKGRQIVSFVTVFFYGVAIWCLFYFFKVAVMDFRPVVGLTCLIGFVTGALVGTVNLWRWMVIRKRQYIPFLLWLRRGMRV